MALTSAHTLTLTASTLAELRDFVRATDHLPDTATVRARTRFGANSDGSLLRQLHVHAEGSSTPVGIDDDPAVLNAAKTLEGPRG